MRRWFLKGVLAGSVGTAAVLATAVAVAATVGDPFKLGQPNAINATSSLYGATAHDQLDVANVGTGSNARALGVLGRSPSAPASAIANTNGGPALGLSVNAGKAPFTVNSASKVANLNSDRLDGLDSSNFVQGNAARVLTNRIVMDANASQQTLLTIPGLGFLAVDCYGSGARVIWMNDTGGTIDTWRDFSADPSATVPSYYTAAVDTGTDVIAAYSFPSSQTGTTIGVGAGSQPGARRVAVAHVFAQQSANFAPCSFEALVNVWSSP